MKKILMNAAVAVAMIVALSGCATAAKKSPEELIKAQVDGWAAALTANDLDKLMTYYSDHFTHYEYKDKPGMRAFLNQAKDAGYLTDIKAAYDKAVIKVEGDKAAVYPIDLTASMGALTMELKFGKEDAGWLIIGSEANM